MPPAGYELAVPTDERPQTHALYRTATGIGEDENITHRIIILLLFV